MFLCNDQELTIRAGNHGGASPVVIDEGQLPEKGVVFSRKFCNRVEFFSEGTLADFNRSLVENEHFGSFFPFFNDRIATFERAKLKHLSDPLESLGIMLERRKNNDVL